MALFFKYKPNELYAAGFKLFCTNAKHAFCRHRVLLSVRGRSKTVMRFSCEIIRDKTLSVSSSTEVIEEPANMQGIITVGSKMSLLEIEKLVKYFLSTENSDFVGLVLLRCCSNCVPFLNAKYKIKLSQNVLKILNQKGKKMARHHFEALLRCYIENGHRIDLHKFLFELECADVTPDAKMYSMILKCVCAKGQMDDAMKVIKMLQNNNVSLNESHYSDLVLGWGLLSDFHKINDTIKEMKKLEIPIGSLVHMSLLKVFSAYGGDLSFLKKLLSMAKIKEIEFSDKQIMEIIENLAIHQNYCLIPEVMDEVKNYQVQEMRDLVVKLIFNKWTESAAHVVKVAKDKNLPILEMSQYFIKELVSNKLPLEDLISFGSALVEKKIDDYALHEIFYCLFSQGAIEDCKKVFETMKDMKIELRAHYVWPLLLKEFNRCGEKGMFEVLSWMKELKMNVNTKTLIYIVFPKIKLNSWTALKLSDVTGWEVNKIRLSLLFFYLKKGDIEEAADFVKIFPSVLIYCTKGNWLVRLGKAILKSPNANGMTNFLVSLNPSLVDDLLLSLVNDELDVPLTSKLTEVLEMLNAHNWKISESCYEALMNLVPESLRTPSIEKLLKEMIESENISNDKYHNRMAFYRNPHAFENFDLESDGKDDPVPLLQKFLFHYIYTGCWKEAYRIKWQLIEEGADLSSFFMRKWMLTVCVKNQDLHNSRKYYLSLQVNYPEFKLSLSRVINFCALLAEKGLHKESLRILSEGKFHTQTLKNLEQSVRCLMEALATHNSLELFEDYFQELDGRVTWSNFLLTPCVEGFVKRNNLEDAVKMFEKICFERHVSPYIIDLMNLALMKKDKSALNRIKKACEWVLGKKTTFFLETIAISKLGDINRLQQVLRVHELAFGLFSQPPFSCPLQQVVLEKSFQKQCQKFVTKGNIDELLNFYYALEKSKKGFLVLEFILDCYDRLADYKGAEKFMENLKEKNVNVPHSFRTQMEEFLSGRKVACPPL